MKKLALSFLLALPLAAHAQDVPPVDPPATGISPLCRYYLELAPPARVRDVRRTFGPIINADESIPKKARGNTLRCMVDVVEQLRVPTVLACLDHALTSAEESAWQSAVDQGYAICAPDTNPAAVDGGSVLQGFGRK